MAGWFSPLDFDLFNWFLSRPGEPGDLLEIGVFKGQSAVVIGANQHAGERFTVCDIFERSDYEGLARKDFEAAYLRFHSRLPEIVDDTSLNIRNYVASQSCRFIHVDGSHMYETVKEDVAASIDLASHNAVVVFDDYRSIQTPGVAAAVWAACTEERLFPICGSQVKLYATVSPSGPLLDELGKWLDTTDLLHERQRVLGGEMFWVSPPPPSRRSAISELITAAIRDRLMPRK